MFLVHCAPISNALGLTEPPSKFILTVHTHFSQSLRPDPTAWPLCRTRPSFPQKPSARSSCTPIRIAPRTSGTPFSDAQRLAFLGQKMAETVYLCIVGDRMRGKDAAQIQTYFNRTFLRFAERTARTYQWGRHIRYPQNVNGNCPQEDHRLFFTYVGAISAQYHGDAFSRLQEWIIALLQFYGAD
ncbi:hypothetical protein ONZ51_g13355 [Trametes cubensis]|uniref:Uncharacterized protein n=1 Tax=Trametes cubensis TaxID=1111947 RepID=A0AAD7TEJ0_9APHY|nr:hypothetical protein ONZ51_g13355 [Trametes cubensis]